MRVALLALILAFAGTADAGSFSLVATSPQLSAALEPISFDVFFTTDPGEADVLAARLRIRFEPADFPGEVNFALSNTSESAFEVAQWNLDLDRQFGPTDQIELSVQQLTLDPLNAANGLKLGELIFTPPALGVYTLSHVATSGAVDASLLRIANNTPDGLAVIFPEPSALFMVTLGFFGFRTHRRSVGNAQPSA